MEVLCKHCGTGFVPKRKEQIYCSIVCYNKYRAGLLCLKHGLERNKRKQCPKCLLEYHKKYLSTEKGMVALKRYEISTKRKRSLKKYYSSEKGKAKRRQYHQRYRDTPKGKSREKIHHLVNQAIRSGKLNRSPCVVCGNPISEAHHAWSYAEEDALRVVFLCKEHHTLADRNPVFNEEVKSKAPVV